MSAGLLEIPLVIRVGVDSKYGVQHLQDWSALYAHMSGLKVYYPATPYDAKGTMNLALCGTDPTVFFESQLLYDKAKEFQSGGVPEGYYEVPEGEPVVRREGSDLTIAILSTTLYRAFEAAGILQSEYGLLIEVIDLQFVAPPNLDPMAESVKKTGRLLLGSGAVECGPFLQDVASKMQSTAFDHLDTPVMVMGSCNAVTLAAELKKEFFLQPEWLVGAVRERTLPLSGHVTISDQTTAELAHRIREGLRAHLSKLVEPYCNISSRSWLSRTATSPPETG